MWCGGQAYSPVTCQVLSYNFGTVKSGKNLIHDDICHLYNCGMGKQLYVRQI